MFVYMMWCLSIFVFFMSDVECSLTFCNLKVTTFCLEENGAGTTRWLFFPCHFYVTEIICASIRRCVYKKKIVLLNQMCCEARVVHLKMPYVCLWGGQTNAFMRGREGRDEMLIRETWWKCYAASFYVPLYIYIIHICLGRDLWPPPIQNDVA